MNFIVSIYARFNSSGRINQCRTVISLTTLHNIYFNRIIYDAFNSWASRHKRIFPLSPRACFSGRFLFFISFHNIYANETQRRENPRLLLIYCRLKLASKKSIHPANEERTWNRSYSNGLSAIGNIINALIAPRGRSENGGDSVDFILESRVSRSKESWWNITKRKTTIRVLWAMESQSTARLMLSINIFRQSNPTIENSTHFDFKYHDFTKRALLIA